MIPFPKRIAMLNKPEIILGRIPPYFDIGEMIMSDKPEVVLGTKLEAVESNEVRASVEEDLKQPEPDETTAKKIIYGEASLVYKGK